MTETSETAGAWSGPEALLTQSWNMFKERFWLFWGVTGLGAALTTAAFAVPLLLAGAVHIAASLGPLAWILAALISLSAALWIGSWAQIAIFDAALRDSPTLTDCYARAWPKIAPFSWVCVLYMIVVGGGFFLLVIPGLYLAVALAFAPFICLEEGLSGADALARSLEYSRGRWPALALRLGLIAGVSSLPSMIPLIGWLAGLVLAPLPLAAAALLYRETRGAAPTPPAERWPLALAAAGWLIPVWLTARFVPVAMNMGPAYLGQARALMAALGVAR